MVTVRTALFGLLTLVASAHASQAPLVASERHADAAEGVNEYGQLVGHWSCLGSTPQPDGSWQEASSRATWSWYWVLDGHAVQDVWQPPKDAGPGASMGTNLRTYNAETGMWEVVWTTAANPRIEHFDSQARNGELHITTKREATATYPTHMMHITFYNISEDHFDWKYESSAVTDGMNWTEVSRISCDRTDA